MTTGLILVDVMGYQSLLYHLWQFERNLICIETEEKGRRKERKEGQIGKGKERGKSLQGG